MFGYALLCGALITVGTYYIFNPYMAFTPKKNINRTRENSFGHPYYWNLRYDPIQYVHHPDVYNRPHKKRSYIRNVMYIE